MNTDTSLVWNAYFLDDDTMSADDATKVASQQSIKAYIDSRVTDINWLTEDSAITDGDELIYYNWASNVKVDYTNLSANIRWDIATPAILQSTRSVSAASGTVSLAHWLWVTPKSVQITCTDTAWSDVFTVISNWFSNGTANMCTYVNQTTWPALVNWNDASNAINYRLWDAGGNYLQTATVSLDATNVDLVWTLTTTSTPSVTGTLFITLIAIP